MMARVAIACAVGLLTGACFADVTFNAEQRTITVIGFSEQHPGTLQDVLDAARKANWPGGSLDAVTQTITLDGSLIIGSADGSDTWFRIGSSDRPLETLVIKGDLILHEPKPIPNAYRRFTGRNVLLIGDPTDAEMRPTIKFVCEKPHQYGLVVADGNTLRIHNTIITAATQDRAHSARCEIRSREVEIVDSTLSWIAGDMTYGFSSQANPLRGVTFEHGDIALGNGPQWAVDCVFRDLQSAVFDGGSLNATLMRCRFEGNKRNWDLGFTCSGITAIDCEFGEETDPGPHLRRGRIGDGPWQHPRFIALRHIVVRVVDESGEPIEDALVEVTEVTGDLSAVHHGAAMTGPDGRTPAPDAYGALLVTDYAYQATDVVPEPDSRDCRVAIWDYRYDVRASAEGYLTGIVQDVDLDQSWVEGTITLKKH
ncbi:MAG: carboxypeptidase regulatory-like domain-containing protein [Armatimonadetes bacterium]|nr:carboxypeptidase regulatory-like domain-containing protein [Armatimonadota bacterium]